jgi:SAM-dependent methyltransferase
MTYAPRPSEADVDAKYRFLQKTEKHIGGRKPGRKALTIERRRAENIYRAVTSRAERRRLTVLDVGGGDGKLLMPFLEHGHECELVDYNVEPLEGVRKVGDTLNDLSADRTYDVIICSHVLEHLAEPAATVHDMKKRLASDGVIYGEVPLGVWKGIGVDRDPVTHINFFAVHSFGKLFTAQGLELAALERRVGSYNRRIDVVVALARHSVETVSGPSGDGVAETRSLLRPSVGMEFRRRWRLRRIGPGRMVGIHNV